MSHESTSSGQNDRIPEGMPMQQFMEAEVSVLGQVFGEDDTKWMEWLNEETEHGEHLRELVAKCYLEDQQNFSSDCVKEVVDILRHDLEKQNQNLH
ncbi:MAG: hypothetical protein KBC35_03110 [Candidatus Pacebacteria bacterium]|nr:hypothetical protein [Candidatus Paceibacterota bacterium]